VCSNLVAALLLRDYQITVTNKSVADDRVGGRGPTRRRKLSDEGKQAAVTYGKEHLKARKARKKYMEEKDDLLYAEDSLVIVYYTEEGQIYGVDVRGDDWCVSLRCLICYENDVK
jgi:hypothetical protein